MDSRRPSTAAILICLRVVGLSGVSIPCLMQPLGGAPVVGHLQNVVIYCEGRCFFLKAGKEMPMYSQWTPVVHTCGACSTLVYTCVILVSACCDDSAAYGTSECGSTPYRRTCFAVSTSVFLFSFPEKSIGSADLRLSSNVAHT